MSGETAFGTLIGRLAQADPDRPAVTCDDLTITRAELEARTNRLARAYRELGVTRGLARDHRPAERDRVLSRRRSRRGSSARRPQPISSRLPAAERRAIIELANPSLVVGVDRVGGAGTADGLRRLRARRRRCRRSRCRRSSRRRSRRRRRAGARAGRSSSSRPSGRCGRRSTRLATLLRMPRDGVHLVTGPLYHNGPFTARLLALFAGNHVVVMPRFDAERALALIERHRVDWMYAVPTMMHRIWRLPDAERARFDLSSLRVVFHMAAPCPAVAQGGVDRLARRRAHPRALRRHRGAGHHVHHRRRVARAPRLGRPPALRRDADPRRGRQRAARRARSARSGCGAARSAADVPLRRRRRRRRAPDSWESLGDMGWKDEDGYLYLADRDTDMILVGGANVYPAEVEAALDEHPSVASSCVIGLPDEDSATCVHAIVQAAAPVDRRRAARVPRRAAREVQGAAHVRVRVAEPLRDDDGKVRRSALRAERAAARGAGC